MIAGTETRATAILAAVIRAYPDTACAAFNHCGAAVEAIDPSTVEVEETSKRGRTDIKFTAGDTTIIVEAKIDAPPSSEQVERYLHGNTATTSAVLLVPQIVLPEATELLNDIDGAQVVSWEQLLEELEEATPIARGLTFDITATQAMPSTKAKVRAAMHAAHKAVDTRLCKVEVSGTATGRPSIDIAVPETYVFGQIEAPRNPSGPLRFSTAIGIMTDESDYEEADKRALMQQALRQAGSLLDHNSIAYNRHSSASWNATRLGMDDQPWLARGYQDSYAGVRLPPQASAEEAIHAAIPTAQVYAQVSREIWPSYD